MDWRVSAVFPHESKGKGEPIANSVAFNHDGSLCASSHQQGIIDLYSCERGERESVFHSKEVGCGLIQFTHHPMCTLHAATTRDAKRSGLISYHSLYDNKIMRFFKGHNMPVTSIAVSPKDDVFLSSAGDRKIILWDLRTPVPQACSKDKESRLYQCAYSTSGLQFAVLSSEGSLSLFDVRKMSKGPIQTTPEASLQKRHSNFRVTFYNDDPVTLRQDNVITFHERTDITKSSTIHVVDEDITSNIVAGGGPQELVVGCRSGNVYCCDLTTKLKKMRNIGRRQSQPGKESDDQEDSSAKHEKAVTAVGVNPTKRMIASADKTVAFWLPKKE